MTFLDPKRTRWQLYAILAIAALLRFVDLGAHSLLFDEAFVAVGARDIAINHTPMWDAISNAPFVALLALIVRLFGDSAFVLRTLPALAGTLSVWVLYVLQRRFFGRQTALLGTLLFAIHPFAVAFSRILFVDAIQVFFVLVGWLVLDRYVLEADRARRRWYFWEAVFIWGLAFLMKYNAIVPGGLWILGGLIGGRYTFRNCIPAAVAVLLGPVITLAIWPYDSPFWFAAYLRQGGNYDLGAAAQYYIVKSRLIFFGLSPLVIAMALVLRFRAPSEHTKATALFAIYGLAFVLTVTLLGRTFERYLLAIVPVLALTVAGIVRWLWQQYREANTASDRLLPLGAVIFIGAVIAVGMTIEYSNYGAYLDNSVDIGDVVQTVRSEKTAETRVFWYVPEPIAGYYLGFTRDYSRALAPDTVKPAYHNYFEGHAVDHATDRTSYHVLDIRKFAREQGVWRLITHWSEASDSIRTLGTRRLSDVPYVDYLSDTICRPGDLVVVPAGVQDIQGEPAMQRVDTNALPPMISHLPTDRFSVVAAFRPEGRAPVTDTIPTKYRAGIWILRKR